MIFQVLWRSDIMKYSVNWITKGKGLKYKEFGENKEKAYNFWRKHQNQDASLWAGEKGNYEDYFHASWITSWGSQKSEQEIKEDFIKFNKRMEHMLRI